MTDLAPYQTKTGDWMLAIHRVAVDSAEIWFGTLCPTLRMPDKARIVLMDADGAKVSEHVIAREQWKRPFSRLNQRFFAVHCFTGLQPAHYYRVRFDRLLPPEADFGDAAWQDVSSGEFSTLPLALPDEGQGQFSVGIAACFYSQNDGGAAASAYKRLFKRGPEDVRPDITFLTGDQVYLDIGMDSISFDGSEIWQRIAGDYERNWRLLGDFMRHGGTWMLPDDHEYWNDFPFYDTPLPTLWPLRADNVHKAWTSAALDGVNNVQRCTSVDIFTIGNDLSFCLADFRTRRHEQGFIDEAGLQKIEQWAQQLTTPGVFVTSQNLMDEPKGPEKNLTHFTEQYTRLINALGASGHDIVCLTGDVHFGRVATAPLGKSGARLIEVVSSPLSNLTGLNGVAAAVANKKPGVFPPYGDSQPISYDRQFFVSSEKGDLFSAYPKTRTREHFMTVGFARRKTGGVTLSVDAWLVRKNDASGMPKRDFKTPFTTLLR